MSDNKSLFPAIEPIWENTDNSAESITVDKSNNVISSQAALPSFTDDISGGTVEDINEIATNAAVYAEKDNESAPLDTQEAPLIEAIDEEPLVVVVMDEAFTLNYSNPELLIATHPDALVELQSYLEPPPQRAKLYQTGSHGNRVMTTLIDTFKLSGDDELFNKIKILPIVTPNNVRVALNDNGEAIVDDSNIDLLWQRVIEPKERYKDGEAGGINIGAVSFSLGFDRDLFIKIIYDEFEPAPRTDALLTTWKQTAEGKALIQKFVDEYDTQYNQVLQKLEDVHVPMVIAAGNAGTNIDLEANHDWPASIESDATIVVGNLGENNAPTVDSSFGKKSVDLYIDGSIDPHSNVKWSTSPYRTADINYTTDWHSFSSMIDFAANNGATSYSAPKGAALVILEKLKEPNLTTAEHKAALLELTTDGAGGIKMVDLDTTIQALAPPDNEEEKLTSVTISLLRDINGKVLNREISTDVVAGEQIVREGMLDSFTNGYNFAYQVNGSSQVDKKYNFALHSTPQVDSQFISALEWYGETYDYETAERVGETIIPTVNTILDRPQQNSLWERQVDVYANNQEIITTRYAVTNTEGTHLVQSEIDGDKVTVSSPYWNRRYIYQIPDDILNIEGIERENLVTTLYTDLPRALTSSEQLDSAVLQNPEQAFKFLSPFIAYTSDEVTGLLKNIDLNVTEHTKSITEMPVQKNVTDNTTLPITQPIFTEVNDTIPQQALWSPNIFENIHPVSDSQPLPKPEKDITANTSLSSLGWPFQTAAATTGEEDEAKLKDPDSINMLQKSDTHPSITAEKEDPVIIAVIDTGIDFNGLNPELWSYAYKGKDLPDGNDTDDDGYIDNHIGTYIYGDGNASDEYYKRDENGRIVKQSIHGTSVADEITHTVEAYGQSTPYGNIKIMPIGIYERGDNYSEVDFIPNQITHALNIVIDNKEAGENIVAVNVSMGFLLSEDFDETNEALQKLEALNVGVYFSAGNESESFVSGIDIKSDDFNPKGPGLQLLDKDELTNVLSVGAVYRSDRRLTNYSNNGAGVDVYGIDPSYDSGDRSNQLNFEWPRWKGTSHTAPQVTGVVGLVYEENKDNPPSIAEVNKVIKETAILNNQGEYVLDPEAVVNHFRQLQPNETNDKPELLSQRSYTERFLASVDDVLHARHIWKENGDTTFRVEARQDSKISYEVSNSDHSKRGGHLKIYDYSVLPYTNRSSDPAGSLRVSTSRDIVPVPISDEMAKLVTTRPEIDKAVTEGRNIVEQIFVDGSGAIVNNYIHEQGFASEDDAYNKIGSQISYYDQKINYQLDESGNQIGTLHIDALSETGNAYSADYPFEVQSGDNVAETFYPSINYDAELYQSSEGPLVSLQREEKHYEYATQKNEQSHTLTANALSKPEEGLFSLNLNKLKADVTNAWVNFEDNLGNALGSDKDNNPDNNLNTLSNETSVSTTFIKPASHIPMMINAAILQSSKLKDPDPTDTETAIDAWVEAVEKPLNPA